MKVKTSVTLSPEVLAGIDKLSDGMSRSEFIEKVLKRQILLAQREERGRKDAAIYAQMASDPVHQREIDEVLELQVPWFELGSDEDGDLAEG